MPLREFRASGDNWRELFGSEGHLPARPSLQALLRNLDDDALRNAITTLSERQKAILVGRRREDVPTSKLSAYLALGGLKQIP